MINRIVIDLCAGTGAWSEPYLRAGYDVRRVTLPLDDVRLYHYPGKVYGILAAPDCRCFSGAGARWWAKMDTSELLQAIAVSDACCRIILMCNPAGFWVLENPVGRLRRWLGPPTMTFNPCDYGDPYTKRTLLWGKFNRPQLKKVDPIEGSKMWAKYGGNSERTKRLRSITPSGFAQAFFEANQ